METSILTSIKKMLGIDSEYTHFDSDIIININTTLMVLSQLGVSNNFSITSKDNTWSELLEEREDLEAIKTYIYLKVRLLFDPPSSSFVLSAIERQITELEWRINTQA